MIKYSFIVPVYNTEKYLKKCLDYLVKQTLKDFEIIIVNDGSTDNSSQIINKYQEKYSNIKLIEQKNQGLSMARNNSVKKALGEYLIFIDSDDYVEPDLLKRIDENIEDVDVLRFQIYEEDESYKNKVKVEEVPFDMVDGKTAIKLITNYKYVEPAWCYVYRKEYYIKNKFNFKKGVYHEDFGLIPYVIYKAGKVKSIDYAGYHYVTRNGSIMNNTSYDKTIKKAYDMLEQYKDLRSKVEIRKENHDNYFLSYVANCAIVKTKTLKGKERKEYVEELKEIKAYNDILVNSFVRKIKKVLLKISPNLYLKVVK